VRLTQEKDLVIELKSIYKFNMETANCGEYAQETTLKESADGKALIFLSNYRALVFDPLTLQLRHNLNRRVLDIAGGTVLF